MSDDLFEERNAPGPAAEKSTAAAQRPLLGVAAGVGAMVAGTAFWIFAAQKFQLTWMSAAVAFGIASAIKYAGRSKDLWYGIVGALLAFIAAIAGNLATAIFIVSKRGRTPAEILSQLDVGTAITFLKALGGPMGIVFYAGALYIGFWFSFKHVAKKQPIDLD